MPTILVVDDEPANIALLRDALRDSYRVLAALSGEKALEVLLGAQPPDLVLLDVMMPGMGGHELCRRVRAEPRLVGIPIIFVSAADDIDSKMRGFEVGGVDYVTKPFEIPEVLARVATHLELEAARVRLEEQNRQIVEAANFREEVERINRHDLKGPLHSMIGLPELMLEEPNLTEDQRENLQLIMDSARRMLLMINSSLDLMKMERGVYHISPACVDIPRLLGEIGKGRQDPWAGEDRLRIEVEGPGKAAGEEMLLYSLFYNLVQNAWEAAPKGSPIEARISSVAPTPRVSREGQAGPQGPLLRLRLRNAGEVPAAVRDRFFDKFATAGKEKGTGIGTYSAKLICETHGGSIAVDTGEPGHTTLIVELPAWMAEE